MIMKNDDFKFFIENHDILLKRHLNKYIVIKDRNVLFCGDSFKDALSKALDGGLELGTFIIQLCSEGESGYTQTFHSRVIFA